MVSNLPALKTLPGTMEPTSVSLGNSRAGALEPQLCMGLLPLWGSAISSLPFLNFKTLAPRLWILIHTWACL